MLIGMNLDGLNGSPEKGHGKINQEYFSPTVAELDYYGGKGMKLHRLNFLWERVQHSLNAALDPEDIGYVDNVVNAANERGQQVYICVFNYGRYNGKVIGSADVPISAFAELWRKLATHFKGRVWGYDLMNEPYKMSVGDKAGKFVWQECAQAAINAIREIDSATILVPGYGYNSTLYWKDRTDNIKDITGTNLLFEGHSYFDSDTSGTHFEDDPSLTPSPAGRGEYVIKPFVSWLRANGKKGIIGEMGWPQSDFWCNTVARPALDYIAANSDVLLSVQIHTAGPHWGTYQQSLEPTKDGAGNYVDKPQMNTLENYIGGDVTTIDVQIIMVKKDQFEARFTVVWDNAGQLTPIQGATVTVGSLSGVTGADGKVTLGPLTAGSYEAKATHADFKDATQTFVCA